MASASPSAAIPARSFMTALPGEAELSSYWRAKRAQGSCLHLPDGSVLEDDVGDLEDPPVRRAREARVASAHLLLVEALVLDRAESLPRYVARDLGRQEDHDVDLGRRDPALGAHPLGDAPHDLVPPEPPSRVADPARGVVVLELRELVLLERAGPAAGDVDEEEPVGRVGEGDRAEVEVGDDVLPLLVARVRDEQARDVRVLELRAALERVGDPVVHHLEVLLDDDRVLAVLGVVGDHRVVVRGRWLRVDERTRVLRRAGRPRRGLGSDDVAERTRLGSVVVLAPRKLSGVGLRSLRGRDRRLDLPRLRLRLVDLRLRRRRRAHADARVLLRRRHGRRRSRLRLDLLHDRLLHVVAALDRRGSGRKGLCHGRRRRRRRNYRRRRRRRRRQNRRRRRLRGLDLGDDVRLLAVPFDRALPRILLLGKDGSLEVDQLALRLLLAIGRRGRGRRRRGLGGLLRLGGLLELLRILGRELGLGLLLHVGGALLDALERELFVLGLLRHARSVVGVAALVLGVLLSLLRLLLLVEDDASLDLAVVLCLLGDALVLELLRRRLLFFLLGFGLLRLFLRRLGLLRLLLLELLEVFLFLLELELLVLGPLLLLEDGGHDLGEVLVRAELDLHVLLGLELVELRLLKELVVAEDVVAIDDEEVDEEARRHEDEEELHAHEGLGGARDRGQVEVHEPASERGPRAEGALHDPLLRPRTSSSAGSRRPRSIGVLSATTALGSSAPRVS